MPLKTPRRFFSDSFTLSAAVATSGLLGSGLLGELEGKGLEYHFNLLKLKFGRINWPHGVVGMKIFGEG